MELVNLHETLRNINTDSSPIYVLDTDLYDVHGDALQIMLYPLINQQMKITDGAMVINEMHVQSWPKARINQQVVQADTTNSVRISRDEQLQIIVANQLDAIVFGKQLMLSVMTNLLRQLGEYE